MVLRRNLQKSRESGLILVHHRANLLSDLEQSSIVVHNCSVFGKRTCWLMSKMAISFREVKSSNAASMAGIWVSIEINQCQSALAREET